MAIIDFLKRQVFTATWEYKSKGTIWRLLPTKPGLFVGEDRDIQTKDTGFFCLDQQSGRVLWERLKFPERWWIGIDGASGDFVFIHGFVKPDMPQHLGITSVNLHSGTIAWSNPEDTFILALDDSIFASRTSAAGSVLLELDSRTGNPLHEWNDGSEALRSARVQLREHMSDEPVFPAPLGASGVIDERAEALVHKHCRMDDIVGGMDVLQANGLLFFSYHERGGDNAADGLRNILKVIDLNNNTPVLTETLNTGVSGVVPESFFVQRNMLYFIRNHSTLTAVNLHERTR